MAATMATMAILNTKCIKSPTMIHSKPTPQPKPAQKTLLFSKNPIESSAVTGALAGAFFAGLSSCEPAMAAQQLAQIADGSDNRGLALLLPLVPAIGWVLFNILQPALNQINRMRNEKALIVGLGLGLGGLLWTGGPAEAAVAEAAGSDNRGTLLLIVILPAIGWVLFNILQPALNQLNRMRSD